VKNLVMLVVFLLPASRAKNFVLRCLGHPIDRTAQIGPNLVVGVSRFEAGPGAKVVIGNVFRGLAEVSLAPGVSIGQLNWFTAAPLFVGTTAEAAKLVLADNALITSRHYVDCSGGVFLDAYSMVGGVRSILLTHQANHVTGRQECAAIRIGEYSLLNGANRMVAGSALPARSMTGIGAVVLPGLSAPARLYAGVPARDVKSVEGSEMFRRTNVIITL
jgi:acetyltransferase-like isoleucine patch superfamily enzyme